MKSEGKILSGLVAQIINSRELVINIGKNDGVQVYMKFAVFAETPLEIYDPETQELLDTVEREKIRVEVTHVRERIAICGTYRKVLPEPLSPEEGYIKIGDRVLRVGGNEVSIAKKRVKIWIDRELSNG